MTGKRARRLPRRRRQGRLILVLGGASSGKSEVALTLTGRSTGRSRQAFIATGEPLDAEMAEKIRRHRAARGSAWETVEVPIELTEWFAAKGRAYRTIVVDCLTLWLSNLIGRGTSAEKISGMVSDLLTTIRSLVHSGARVVLVSNELGLGIVPVDVGTRRFRDLAGRANQQVAAAADEVHVVISGLSIRLKP